MVGQSQSQRGERGGHSIPATAFLYPCLCLEGPMAGDPELGRGPGVYDPGELRHPDDRERGEERDGGGGHRLRLSDALP